MANPRPALQCYIASEINTSIDSFLEKEGFAHGIIMFAVPELGLLFRCRAEGELIDLEFGAFFSLLRFLKTYLVEDKLPQLRVFSSNSEFVFSFTPGSKHLAKGSVREKLLREFGAETRLQISYIEVRKNRCWVSPGDYPSMPESSAPILKPAVKKDTRIDCKPFQRGIRL